MISPSLLFVLALLLSRSLAGAQSDLDFARDARPFLDAYCAKCHNAEKTKGGINLDIFKDEVSLYQHRTRVEEVVEQLRKKVMPPEDAKQPEEVLRAKLADWLTWKLENVDYTRFRNPGYMPSHRLTRRQYRNTIRDLVGMGMEAADDLPTDEATHGFDQMGEVQDVSAVHLEKYLEAANYILDRVFVPAAQTWPFDPRKMEYVRHFGLSGNDEKISFPADAPDHEVTDRAHVIYCTGGQPARRSVEPDATGRGSEELRQQQRRHSRAGVRMRGGYGKKMDGKNMKTPTRHHLKSTPHLSAIHLFAIPPTRGVCLRRTNPAT